MYPDDRRYSKEHEWVRPSGGEATVGITQFAQDQLGDIVYVELPEAGREVGAGDVLGTVESVKAVSEIYAPIGGRIVDTNPKLGAEPELLNRDPHGEGWYCRIRVADPGEVDRLMDAASYEQLTRSGA